MCGIAGLFNLGSVIEMKRMLNSMISRGPDAEGIVNDEKNAVLLGHRRLSIIDLSTDANQPMTDSSGRYSITFNGEIYNYREIRQELENAGHIFLTSSDTEVILASFINWGDACLKLFRGMFAIAILDRGVNHSCPSLLLARDSFGIKPLVYSFEKNGFAFASEIGALMASGLFKRSINPSSLTEYLRFGSVSQPKSIIYGISYLEAGTAMHVYDEGRKYKIFKYDDPISRINKLKVESHSLPYCEQVIRTRELLDKAAKYNLVADTSVGSFLSGGVDSTAVSALIQRNMSTKLKTFSLGFTDSNEVPNENINAMYAAKHLGTEHTEVQLKTSEIQTHFDSILRKIDQPSRDGINTFLISYFTSKRLKVAISGLGGDEIFAGYPHFKYFYDAAQGPSRIIDEFASILYRIRPNRLMISSFLKQRKKAEQISFLRSLLSVRSLKIRLNSSLQSYIDDISPKDLLDDRIQDWDPISTLSIYECSGYLKNTLLRDTDVMSMAHSLEVRPILLDSELVEFALSLPAESKIRNGRLKSILIDAVKDIIPRECYQRKKEGFELPFSTWLNGPLIDISISALNSDIAKEIFNSDYLKFLRQSALKKDLSRDSWPTILLLSWLNFNRYSL